LFLIIHSNFTLTKPRCKYTNISEHTRKNFIFFRFFTLKPHQTNCNSTIIHNQVTCPLLPYQHKHNNLHNHYRPTQRNGATRNSKKISANQTDISSLPSESRGGYRLPSAAAMPSAWLPSASLPPPSSLTSCTRPRLSIHRRRRCNLPTVQK